jgi:hypothetical protein
VSSARFSLNSLASMARSRLTNLKSDLGLSEFTNNDRVKKNLPVFHPSVLH